MTSCQRAPAHRQSAFGLRMTAQPFSWSLNSSPKSAHMQRAEKLALSTRTKTERAPHPNWPASCSEKEQRVDLSLVLAHGVCETQPASRALPCRTRQVRLVYLSTPYWRVAGLDLSYTFDPATRIHNLQPYSTEVL